MSKPNYNKTNKNNNNGSKSARTNKNNNKRNSHNNTVREVASSNTQGEIPSGHQEYSLYFTDAKLADQCSYVSNRNVLDIRRQMPGTSFFYPTVVAHGFNPSCGVSYYDKSRKLIYPSGIKMAAKKLRTAAISNNGRITQWSSEDMATLIMLIGEYIAMTEYGRRVFGSYLKFAELNRDIPESFLTAMGIDYDDFVAKVNSYRTRFNALINFGAPIVIPMDKIPYFKKCRLLYKDIYQDAAAGQMCYHINIPRTTWHLDETSHEGSRLVTVGVTQDLSRIYQTTDVTASQSEWKVDYHEGVAMHQPISVRTFGDWLDKVYEPLVNSLIDSETFNNIYSDLRNSKFQAQYSFDFWKPELVYEDYKTEVLESEDWKNIYHNCRYTGDVTYPKDLIVEGKLVSPAYNDVQANPMSGDVVFNPAFLHCHSFDNGMYNSKGYAYNAELILDFPTSDPSLNQRVDAMMYQPIPRDMPNFTGSDDPFTGAINWLLPDHYMTNQWVYVGNRYHELGMWKLIPIIDNAIQENVVHVTRQLVDNVPANTYTTGYDLITYNDETHEVDWEFQSETTASYKEDFISMEMLLNYMNYSNIGLKHVTDQLEQDQGYIYERYPIGNLDEWYALEPNKYEDMYEHTFLTLFSADGILR